MFQTPNLIKLVVSAILIIPKIYSLTPLGIILRTHLLILRSHHNLLIHLLNVLGLIEKLKHFRFC